VDLHKSILEGSGIQRVLQDEYVGRMRPYAVPGDTDRGRKIVEDFIKDSAT
jgi:hypothetical protein